MDRDNYPVAAVRHYVDGKILFENSRFDNAMCHFAFSAECAIKAMYEQMSQSNARSLSHAAEKEWDSIVQYLTAIRIMDAKAGNLLARTEIPEKLFHEHPGRRYYLDIHYSPKEVANSENFVKELMHKVVAEVLDGKICIER